MESLHPAESQLQILEELTEALDALSIHLLPHDAYDEQCKKIIRECSESLEGATPGTEKECSQTLILISKICNATCLNEEKVESLALDTLAAAFQLPSTGAKAMLKAMKMPGCATKAVLSMALELLKKLLEVAHVALFSQRWLQLSGPDDFTTVATAMRATLKQVFCDVIDASVHAWMSLPGGEALDCDLLMHLRSNLESTLQLGKTAADAIGQRTDLAKELRSFATLNATWSAVIRLLAAVPTELRSKMFAEGSDFDDLNALLASNVHAAFDNYIRLGDANHYQVVRFWLQHLSKLLAAYPLQGLACWGPLVHLVSGMHHAVLIARHLHPLEVGTEASAVIERLAFTLLHILASNQGKQEKALQKICSIAEAGMDGHVTAFAEKDVPHAAGRLLTALTLMRHAARMAASTRLLFVQIILPWTFRVACSEAVSVVMLGSKEYECFLTAIFSFTSSCHALSAGDREGMAVWQECQEVLFVLACEPNPIHQQLLATSWARLTRQLPDAEATCHIVLLHELACGAAAADAHLPPAERRLSESLSWTAFAGSLLMATSKAVCNGFVARILKESRESITLASLDGAAAAYVGLQLASVACSARLDEEASQAALHLWLELEAALPSAFSEAAEDDTRAVLLLCCLREALQLPLQGVQVSSASIQLILLHLQANAQCQDPPAWVLPAMRLLNHQSGLPDHESVQVCFRTMDKLAAVPKLATECAAFAAYCLQTDDKPDCLFKKALTAEHWAVRHQGMESLLAYARSPLSGDFRLVVPQHIYNPGEARKAGDPPFILLLKSYMERTWTPLHDEAAEQGQMPVSAGFEKATCAAYAKHASSHQRAWLQRIGKIRASPPAAKPEPKLATLLVDPATNLVLTRLQDALQMAKSLSELEQQLHQLPTDAADKQFIFMTRTELCQVVHVISCLCNPSSPSTLEL